MSPANGAVDRLCGHHRSVHDDRYVLRRRALHGA